MSLVHWSVRALLCFSIVSIGIMRTSGFCTSYDGIVALGNDVGSSGTSSDGTNLYVIGKVQNTGILGLPLAVILKYGADSTLSWTIHLQSTLHGYVAPARVHAFSNFVIVSGTFSGNLTVPTSPIATTYIELQAPSSGIFILQYSTAGTLNWARSGFGLNMNSVTTLPSSNGIIVYGSVGSSVTLCNTEQSGEALSNLYLVKYDFTGDCIFGSVSVGDKLSLATAVWLDILMLPNHQELIMVSGTVRNAPLQWGSCATLVNASHTAGFALSINGSTGMCEWIVQGIAQPPQSQILPMSMHSTSLVKTTGNVMFAGQLFGSVTIIGGSTFVVECPQCWGLFALEIASQSGAIVQRMFIASSPQPFSTLFGMRVDQQDNIHTIGSFKGALSTQAQQFLGFDDTTTLFMLTVSAAGALQNLLLLAPLNNVSYSSALYMRVDTFQTTTAVAMYRGSIQVQTFDSSGQLVSTNDVPDSAAVTGVIALQSAANGVMLCKQTVVPSTAQSLFATSVSDTVMGQVVVAGIYGPGQILSSTGCALSSPTVALFLITFLGANGCGPLNDSTRDIVLGIFIPIIVFVLVVITIAVYRRRCAMRASDGELAPLTSATSFTINTE
eukprot:TRINITY_DN4828_c0_g1_i1.p1 TRINITY_DN4828_c0_g1~~TRINITY_DN4828_c0_g1_i1.p1  ORF type:complete len:650 (-),score=95.24 TRINITY_DN4828_c0_g1_i1:46-1881(-)